jgi:hypothetical protein
MTMKRSQARRAQALGTFHGLSVGLVIPAGVGLLAARAAEPTDTPTAASRADSSLGRAEVSCVRTYPARYEAGVRGLIGCHRGRRWNFAIAPNVATPTALPREWVNMLLPVTTTRSLRTGVASEAAGSQGVASC